MDAAHDSGADRRIDFAIAVEDKGSVYPIRSAAYSRGLSRGT
jgi:hypothetical protein